MINLNPLTYGFNPHTTALDSALRSALAGKVIGVSTYGADRPISIWLDDSADSTDQSNALTVANNHDPVFIAASKTTITADGVDKAVIIVIAPKPGAAPVTLLVNGVAVPVTLTAGVGSLEITSLDPGTINISVQSPTNRTTDIFTITAA